MTGDLTRLALLDTGRLRLRLLHRDDAAAVRELTDDPVITGAVHFLPAPFTLADAEQLIGGAADGRDGFIGAWSRASGQLAAVIGAHLHGDDEIEIGYWVRTSQQGKGVATEAVMAVLWALRATFAHHRVVAECRVENAASWHLLEKLGFHAAGMAGRRPGRQRLVLTPIASRFT